MRTLSLLYHDVVRPGAFDESGFPGPAAGTYKLPVEEFERHVAAVVAAARSAPGTVLDRQAATRATPLVLFTFDDGGRSAYEPTASILERFGCRGHFFVTTERIDTPGFLRRQEIRELHARGHVIGSHSVTHPTRMAACGREQLLREWRESVATLSAIVGERVLTASVPGGYYARRVAETAAEAGIELLFTSEPTTRSARVGACLVLGRFSLRTSSRASLAASLARGDLVPRARQWLFWNGKKLAKAVGGRAYLRARSLVLRSAEHVT